MSTDERPGAVAPRSLVANSSVLLAARVYGVIAGAVLAIVSVRVLSVEEYGRYATAMAIIVVIGVIAELGISALATRQITLDEARAGRVLGVALSAELVTATGGAALLVPVGLALGYPGDVIVLLGLGTLLVIAQGALAALSGAFQAKRVFELFAVCTAVQATVMLVGGLGALAAGTGAAGLVASAGVAYAAAAASALVLLRRRLHVHPVFDGARRQILAFLLEAAPIAVVASIAVIYGRVALLLLSKLGDERAVALYNLPLMIVELTFLVPAAIATSFYPLLTRQLSDDREDASRSIDLLLRLFMLGGVALALMLAFGGRELITVVFGDRYTEAGDVMALLAVTVIANFFNYLAWYALLASRRERRRVPAVITGLALNVVLGIVLIPEHGASGAAIALVVSDAFMVAWLLWVVHRQVIELRVQSVLLRALPAAIAAAAVALLRLPGGGLVRGAAATGAWIGVLLATRYIRADEWEPLVSPLRRLRQSRAKR